MSAKNDHTGGKNFNAEDLRRYFSGTMSPEEMYALEKASLEDPMLGDALEGMRGVKTDTRDDLALLKKRLAERTDEKKIVRPVWRSWKRLAAAAGILVGLSGLGYFFVLKTSSETTIAAAKKSTADTALTQDEVMAPVAATADSIVTRAADSREKKALKEEQAKPAGAPVPAAAKRNPAKPGTTTAPPAFSKTERVLENEDQPVPAAQPAEKKKDAAADKSAALSRNAQTAPERTRESPEVSGSIPRITETKPAVATGSVMQGKVNGLSVTQGKTDRRPERPFTGIVTDPKGKGIAGAVVQFGNNASVTDSTGRFAVDAKGSDENHLTINSVGYQTQTIITNRLYRTGLTIQLKSASMALSDVAVTGYGMARKQGNVRAAAAPAPVRGWKKYTRYLDENKFSATIDSSLHGIEMISFSVTREGVPVDFIIDESLSRDHDSLAVRLIRNGPGWKPAKDTAHRVSVTLPY